MGLFRADKDGEYSLRQVDALSTGDSISTTFMYTQQEIEMNQIPQWKKLRKELFIHVDTEEQARNYPPDANNPLYVTWLKEDDEHYGEPEYYAWIAPLNKPEVATSDSIMWLTNQIRNWEQVLSENEQDKVEAMKGAEYFDRNISFDSGAPSSYSERLDTTYTKKHTKNWTMRAITGVKTGVWVNAAATFGINLVADYENGGYNNEAYSNQEENYKTWAEMEYSLADANAGTHLSVNVYRSPRGWGDIFSVFGGQTYCPYEGEQRTRYYEKDKHVLSHATVQMDKPVLRVSVGDGLPAQTASVTDVPSGSSAISGQANKK